jgi:hypothetical protein
MNTQVIRVSEENDRKLWRLIFKERWSGTCLDPYTYVFTTDQVRRIKEADIDFEELMPKRVREPKAKKASGARRR